MGGGIAGVLGECVLFVWTVAVAQGLCPDRSFLMGQEELVRPKLVQAELWGACGFIFFFVHIPRVMSIGFSTWDDMESLKYLAKEFKNDKGEVFRGNSKEKWDDENRGNDARLKEIEDEEKSLDAII